jgi:hypothetical protein
MMNIEPGHGDQTGNVTREQQRLIEARSRKVAWRKWGPYLSERSWEALVGELYLADISVPPQLYRELAPPLEIAPIFSQNEIIRLIF